MTKGSCMRAIEALVQKGYTIVITGKEDGIVFKIEKNGEVIGIRADKKENGTTYIGRSCLILEEIING